MPTYEDGLMNTECSAERINFHGLGGRGVVGRFIREGRDRLSAAAKKAWGEHRDERRASISAGVRGYWDAVRQCAVTISIILHICARVPGSHLDILN